MSVIKKIYDKFKRTIGVFNIPKYAKSIGVNVGNNVRFVAMPDFSSEPWLITIKDNVLISGNVKFITHDGSVFTVKRTGDEFKNVIKFGKIVVEEGVFIGLNSTVLPNVRIGKNSIVAACSCVTKDVPDGTVVAGVPARVIGNVSDLAVKWLNSTPEYNRKELNENMKKVSSEIAECYWKQTHSE